jgi:hypothetical protein
MKISKLIPRCAAMAVVLFLGITTTVAQTGEQLELAMLTKKLQLSAEQEESLAPIVAERDQKAPPSEGALASLSSQWVFLFHPFRLSPGQCISINIMGE